MRWTISANARKSPDRKIVKAAAIIVKGLIAKGGERCLQNGARLFGSAPGYGQFHCMAFTLEPASKSLRKPQRRLLLRHRRRDHPVSTQTIASPRPSGDAPAPLRRSRSVQPSVPRRQSRSVPGFPAICFTALAELGAAHHRRSDVAQGRRAELAHRDAQLVAQDFEDTLDPALAERGEPP